MSLEASITEYAECHGHIFMDGTNYRSAMELHKNGVVKPVIHARLAALRDAGVTYYRDGGDILGVSAYARDAAGDYGIDFRACLFATHKRRQYGWIVGHAFDGPADFCRLVRRARAGKADFIKLMISGIMDFQTWGGLTGGGLALEEIAPLVHIAHGEGFAVMAHVNGADRVRAALEAGVDSVEHGYFMDEDCLRLLADRGAVWVPTLAATAGFIGRTGFGPGVAEENLRRQADCIRRGLALGAVIAAGSDAGAFGVPPDTGIHLEHGLLAAAGLAPADIDRGDRAVRTRFTYGG